MTWVGWLVLTLYSLNALFTAAVIGSARKPIEPLDAVIVTAIFIFLWAAVVLVGTGSIR